MYDNVVWRIFWLWTALSLSARETKILWCGLLSHPFSISWIHYVFSLLSISLCCSALVVAYGQSLLICSELKLMAAEHTAPAQTGDIPYLSHLFLISAVFPWEKSKKENIFKGFLMSGAGKNFQLTPSSHPLSKLPKATWVITCKLVIQENIYPEITGNTH